MRISWNWLRTLIDTGDLTPRSAADILTSTGLEVESVEPLEPVKGMLAGVVVGHVTSREKHPDADRLSVCMVDVGGDVPLQIVCGAPNVAEGQKVLVATVGTTLHPVSGEPLVIKKSRIRGVESHGMICAEDELGLGTSHAGILVLEPESTVGTSAGEQLKLAADHLLEIGLTPNRADAMSHFGVARDLAAALRVRTGSSAQARLADVDAFKAGNSPGVHVEVQATEVCRRYTGVTLTDVRVTASPAWLQDRLKSIGQKPINNVVDITNYVQHETGQPLHAFDADKLEGDRIIVRMAKADEAFTTLDGTERKLAPTDLVIADAMKPACIAGVFGGSHSGVSDTTQRIFLESACFDPTSVRRSARRHGLNTDASFRFERGVDPEMTAYALKRAALLIADVAGARVASPITDLIASPTTWASVSLAYARVNALIGTPIAPEEVERVLIALDCRITERSSEGLLVQVPPYRVDVTREADLIEEIIRIIGFDRVPIPARLAIPARPHAELTFDGVQLRVAEHLAARGFQEVMNPSLVSGARTAQLHPEGTSTLIRLLNPLSAELDVMRPTMLFGLLQSAAHNIARQLKDLRFFERGRVYATMDKGSDEQERIALLITGRLTTESWRAKAEVVSVPDLAAEMETLLARMGLEASGIGPLEHPFLRNAAGVSLDGRPLVIWGEVKEHVLRAFGVQQPCFHAELFLPTVQAALAKKRTRFEPVPRFPAVRRDLSLLLDRSVTFTQLRQLAMRNERKLLRAVDLFDVYEGDKLPNGKKSYAISFILQDPERTLTDEQVEKAIGRIRQAFEKELGAEVRS